MSNQPHLWEGKRISRYVKERIHDRNRSTLGEKVSVQKIDLLLDPISNKIKLLKAMVRIDNPIIQLKFDTVSPVSFLNWSTTKETIDKSKKAWFIPSEKLNLVAQFMDYNKQPICTLGALKTNLRSAGWEVKGATFLVTERRVWIFKEDGFGPSRTSGDINHTNISSKRTVKVWGARMRAVGRLQEQILNEIRRFIWETGNFKKPYHELKNQVPLCTIQEKGSRILIHIQDEVEKEIQKLLTEGSITNLDKCTSDCFFAPIVITVKKEY